MRVLVVAALAAAAPLSAQTAATYEVTFEATWSADSFPDDFPPNPHFSRLVGAVHAPEAALWAPGETASDGIEAMAETGAITALLAEVEAIAQGGVDARGVQGGNLPLSPGSVSMTLGLDADAPLVTLVTMLAPSPDWFVGVHGIDLRDGEGWVDERVVDLFVYDAGTDSGTTYTAANDDTDPAEPIARIEAPPFLRDGRPEPVGTFTFRRLGAAPVEAPVGDLAIGAAVPNPTSHGVSVRVYLPEAGARRVSVVDALGREVYAASGPAPGGTETVRLSTTGWAPGVYSLVIEAAGRRAVRPFILAR